MKKAVYIIYLIFLMCNLYSLEIDWLNKADNLSKKKLYEEIDMLKKKLNNNEVDNLTKIGICYHNLSQKNEKVSNEAIKYLTRSLKLKSDPVVKAYLGSSYTLRGGEKKSLSSVDEGLKYLDEAYKDDNTNPVILIIRISVGVGIPKFMFKKRVDVIFSDINKLKDMYAKGEIREDLHANVLSLEVAANIKMDKNDEAKKIFTELINLYPNSKYALNAITIMNKK